MSDHVHHNQVPVQCSAVYVKYEFSLHIFLSDVTFICSDISFSLL